MKLQSFSQHQKLNFRGELEGNSDEKRKKVSALYLQTRKLYEDLRNNNPLWCPHQVKSEPKLAVPTWSSQSTARVNFKQLPPSPPLLPSLPAILQLIPNSTRRKWREARCLVRFLNYQRVLVWPCQVFSSNSEYVHWT